MGQLVCRFDSKFICSFQVSPILESLVNDKTAGPLVMTSIGFLSVFILWILTFIIRHLDHTRAYITSLLIPTTIFTFLTWLQALLKFTHENIYTFDGYEDAIIGLVILASDCQFLLGTVVFLLFNIGVACNRFEPGPVVTWITFLLSLILSAGFSTAGFFLNVSIALVPQTLFVFFVGCVILACLVPLIACCCSGPKSDQSSSPVVANAKSRMIWALFFAIPVVLIVMVKYYVDFHYSKDPENFSRAKSLIFALISYIQPILLLLASILFLPAYRSALCCNQGPAGGGKVQKKGKASPTIAKSNAGVSQQQIPSKLPNAQLQAPPTPTPQGQIDPTLIAYLTNPSLMNSLQSQNQCPTPNQHLALNSTANCNQCAYPPHPEMNQGSQIFVQEPVTLLQVPTIPVTEQWAVTVPQQNVIVTQPSGMAHYAHPNMIQYPNSQQQQR